MRVFKRWMVETNWSWRVAGLGVQWDLYCGFIWLAIDLGPLQISAAQI